MTAHVPATAINAAEPVRNRDWWRVEGTSWKSLGSVAMKVAFFRIRAEARSILHDEHELDLHQAVDALQADAVASGLVDAIGQDAVQEIMSDAFRKKTDDDGYLG